MKNKTSILVGTRHFFYALLVGVIFCGCGSSNSEKQEEQKPLNQIQHIETDDVQVVQIDSCEYVVYGHAGGILHKQNCKFCAERSKK
jgi:hypothetical protein